MDLKEKSKQIRRDILNASFEAKACHLGSALSCVDIMVKLAYETLQEGDRFIFSKASGSATLYAILADQGLFPKDKLAQYLHDYPEASKEVPGVLHSVGSVGHGLAVAVGLALSDRTRKVYVLLSDGECQEGVTYESCLFARQHKLTNLFVIVDNNKLQACGKTKDIMDLTTAFEFMKNTLPNCEIVDTIKGWPIQFMMNDYRWHYKNLTEEDLHQALCQI
jgi:transketolase